MLHKKISGLVLHLTSNGNKWQCGVWIPEEKAQTFIESAKRQLKYNETLANLRDNEFFPNIIKKNNDYFFELSVYKEISSNIKHMKNEKILLEINSNNIPQYIKQAIDCASHTDVMSYLNNYLSNIKSINEKKGEYTHHESIFRVLI